MWNNGTVSTNTGVYLTQGGVAGLKAYLVEIQTPDFQIVNAGNLQFRLYPNGTVFDEQNNFITEGGIQGIKEYVLYLMKSEKSAAKALMEEMKLKEEGGSNYFVYALEALIVMGALIGFLKWRKNRKQRRHEEALLHEHLL